MDNEYDVFDAVYTSSALGLASCMSHFTCNAVVFSSLLLYINRWSGDRLSSGLCLADGLCFHHAACRSRKRNVGYIYACQLHQCQLIVHGSEFARVLNIFASLYNVICVAGSCLRKGNGVYAELALTSIVWLSLVATMTLLSCMTEQCAAVHLMPFYTPSV